MRIVFLLVTLAAAAGAQRSASNPELQKWRIFWADEFDGAANTLPDASKWTYDLGNGKDGWGNQELESYTQSLENVHLDGRGHLIIRALRDKNGGYTSARVKTQGRYFPLYGKIEARIKIPYGQGIWPAFWALGADIDRVGWPQCGEMDIMENIGREPGIQHGSLHGPGYSDGSSITAKYSLPKGQKLSDDFHVYAIIWSEKSIEYLFDGHAYLKVMPAMLPAGKPWVFNRLFYLLLNVAVGGSWPGSPDGSTRFPQEMIVDYVRVSEPAPKN